MPRQSLLWTALPNGLTPDGRALRLSVLLSPRLEPQAAPPTLASFPDLDPWPDTVREARFTVRLGDAEVTLAGGDADGTLGTPDTAAWRALLPSTTPVLAFAFRDRAGHAVLSYDTMAVHLLVQAIHGRLAAAPADELPTVADLLADPLLATLVGNVRELDRAFRVPRTGVRNVAAQLARWRENRFKGMAAPGLAEFQLFHTPASKPTTQTVTPEHDPRTRVTWATHERATIDAAAFVAELDVHRIVAAMSQFPTLLRRLGLVLDFVIPRARLPRGADLPLSVAVALPARRAGRVVRATAAVAARAASPVTRARHTDVAFAAVPRPSPDASALRVADGLLRHDPDRLAVLQADVDGAGIKLLNAARTLAAHADPARQVDPVRHLARRAGLPAVRTAGLMLVHRARAAALGAAFDRARTLDAAVGQAYTLAGAAPALYAEDLVRGWRVDVRDASTGRWRSLCERVAEYRLGGALTLAGLREEGTVRLAATAAADGSDPDVVRLHEALTVWSGWSLAAPPPGRTIGRDDRPETLLRDAPADVPDGIPLRTAFVAAPGTLPRLRYGRTYAVRARAVDLAGNSLPPTTADLPGDAARIAAGAPFRRFEPVPPPALALVGLGADAERPAEGESMGRLAVRSRNDAFDDPAPSPERARRWAVAPRTSVREAELHGALDGPAWGSAAQYELLADRDRDLPELSLELVGPLHPPGEPVRPTPHAALPDGAPLLPYLPDPLCTRVAARLLHHPLLAPSTTIEIPLYPEGRAWPDAAPFQLRVYEAAGERPRFDAATRTLLLPLPKAVRATLRLSAMLDADDLDRLGVWHWIPAAQRTAALARRARAGRLWALTPWREVELVHAVQRPLRRPEITDLALQRPAGATFVRPGVDARVHRASTAQVELRATWHEPRDGGTGPTNAARGDVAFAVKVADPLGEGGPAEHGLPDPADPDRIAFGPVKALGDAARRALRGRVHEFGDTRYRRVEYHLQATSRFREYLERALLVEDPADPASPTTDARLTVAGPAVRAWVPSSAPPPAPEVLYVVPTFGWTRGDDASGARTSWRRGGGLRIWLDRPWNATGYGEMLAVVLPAAGSALDPNAAPYKQAVTQWGNDPAWRSPHVSGVAPAPAAFPLARTAPDPAGAWLPPGAPAGEADQPPGPFPTSGLAHPGLAPGSVEGVVDVAPHDVRWDAERRLWYCDVELEFGGAYFPFVRLALARYQPVSVGGAHLSSIVLADFMALAPDRWLTVTRTDATRRQLRLHGASHTRSAGYEEAWHYRTSRILPGGQKVEEIPTGISPTNVVEVWLEELPAGASADFGWRRTADGAPAPVVGPVRKTTATATTTTTARTAARTAARAVELVRRRDFPALVAESLLPTVRPLPALWSGTLTLPATRPAGTRYRAVIAEYEEYLVDDTDPYDTPLERRERRLVFVEHVELG